MGTVKKRGKLKPTSKHQWLEEISKAYKDAEESIPFSFITGHEISEKDLFHLSPLVCMKFRGIKNNKKNRYNATGTALRSYLENKDANGGLLNDSVFSFSFCYVLAHYGLDLINEEECDSIINYIESNLSELKNKVKT